MSIADSCALRMTASSEESSLSPLAGRVSMVGWSIVVSAGLIVLIAIATGRFSFGDDVLLKAILYLLITGVCGACLRVRGWMRIGTLTEVLSQFMLASMLAALVSVILASTNLPLEDDILQLSDRSIFDFDWQSIIKVSEAFPRSMFVLSYAYTTISWQPLVLMILLCLCGYLEIARVFCAAWAVSLAISVMIFPFVPAVGGYLHNHVARSQTHVLVAAAWRHVEILAPVRDGALRSLSAETLEGLITFPSFHAVAAVLLTWGFWHLRYARWPASALNLAMLISTPFVGGHYLVDVVAGCVIAVSTVVVLTRWQGARTVAARPGSRFQLYLPVFTSIFTRSGGST